MGNLKNRTKKNKRLANNWRKIIRTRKSNKSKVKISKADIHIKDENFINSIDGSDTVNLCCTKNQHLNHRQDDDTSKRTENGYIRKNDKQIYYILQKQDPDQHTVIIRGNFHQGDERFTEFSRGKQCVAASVATLCFFKLFGDPPTWKSSDIDLIVTYGDVQYNASYKKLKREGISPRTSHLLLSEVYPYFKFDRNFFYLNVLDVNDSSHFESNALQLENLTESLHRYFNENENQCGIFTFNNFSFALMKNSDSYFVMNSHATSYTGEPMTPNNSDSAACLTQLFTIKCLANYLFVACDRGYIASENNLLIFYLLTNIKIENKIFGNDISARQRVTRDLFVESKKIDFCRKRKAGPCKNNETTPKRQCIGSINKFIVKGTDKQNQIPDQKTGVMKIEPKIQNQVLIGCGLKNIGNSCFFNACLQALLHVPSINIRLQGTNKNCKCVLCCLFKRTHSYARAPIDPTSIYQSFRMQNNKDMLNGDQQDAHEFWIRLMKLIECKKNSCIKFSSWFEHEIEISVICGMCKVDLKRKENISAHVIEVRGKSTIQEAVNAYFEEQTVESYICASCNGSSEAKKKYFLKTAPKCLYLVLNRFENLIAKINQSIVINEHSKLSGYNDKNEVYEVGYKLVSAINHIGINRAQGHYTAISSPVGNYLYEFDDSHVRRVDAISGFNAYILMYELTTKLDEQSANKFAASDPFPKPVDANNTSFSNDIIHNSETVDATLRTNKRLISPTTIDGIQSMKKEMLTGRRIVDIGYFFEQMETLYKHSEDCDSQMDLIKEIKFGLRSIFKFHCKDCGIWYNVETCRKDDVRMPLNENDEWMHVNEAATLGITATGLGFYHLEEFCANLDIPCMSEKTFTIEDKKLQKLWWKLAKAEAAQALQEEIELAKSIGSVDSSGNALISAEVDGSWAKRCYGKGYSSLSGFASIIGIRTKKVLYFDVKNKYCHVCKLSYAKMCPPNKHECNMNYEGPSTGMEAAIIVEGFQACEKLGARFNQYVGDGDSNTFKELREAGIYKDPEVDIDKLECENHLFRNARSKIDDLSTSTKYKPASRKYIPASLGDSICKGIRSASKHWREANINDIQKLENLEKDCLNAPYHYLENHDKCQEYFCNKTTTPESQEIIELLKADGLFHAILECCNIYFAANAKSLLAGLNNNNSESLNNLIAMNTAGKRVNYVLAGSYKGRCGTGVVQWNCKGRAESKFHKLKNKNSGKLCYKMETKRIRKCAKNAEARQVKPLKKIFKVAKSNKSYGPNCGRPDLPIRSLEAAKKAELTRLDADRNNRDAILRDTYGQRLNPRWYMVRKKLINSIYFHRIVNAQGPKSYKNLLCEMMYSPVDLAKSAEIRHQRLYELEALNCFRATHKDYDLEKTGIFIDKDISFLGASPFRLYGSDSIVIVKCPIKGFKKTIDEAIRTNLLPFWKYNNGNVSINPKGSWYIEMQGMLHITQKEFGHLVVWLGDNEVKIKTVERDDKFWDEEVKEKLVYFYNEAMIKEVVDPRRRRKMDLREFDLQSNTFI